MTDLPAAYELYDQFKRGSADTRQILSQYTNRGSFLAVAKYPVYVSLLTKDTQEAIGRIHPNTQPALTMLMKEGFYLTDEIDLFDGGPKVEAITSEIRTIKKSRVATVEDITAREFNSPRYLISNLNLDFRACQGTMGVHENAKVALNKDTADALSIKIGDKIRYICVSED